MSSVFRSKWALFLVLALVPMMGWADVPNSPSPFTPEIGFTYGVVEVLPTGQITRVDMGQVQVAVTMIIRELVMMHPLVGFTRKVLPQEPLTNPPLGLLEHERIDPKGGICEDFACPFFEKRKEVRVPVLVKLMGGSGAKLIQVTHVDDQRNREYLVQVTGQTVTIIPSTGR